MLFNEKLQELRKRKGLTQEELAECLYVSRTAVSKWESGRGYPNIDSLRAIAKFFSITVDELLSGDEALNIAEEERRKSDSNTRDLVFGLLDVCTSLLFFLPFFAVKSGEAIRAVALLAADGLKIYLRASYIIVTVLIVVSGICTLALQNFSSRAWMISKIKISFSLSVAAVFIFIASLQPYAALFSLTLFLVKGITLIKFR